MGICGISGTDHGNTGLPASLKVLTNLTDIITGASVQSIGSFDDNDEFQFLSLGNNQWAIGGRNTSGQPAVIIVERSAKTVLSGTQYLLEAVAGIVNAILPHPDSDKFIVVWDDDTTAVLTFNSGTRNVTAEGANQPIAITSATYGQQVAVADLQKDGSNLKHGLFTLGLPSSWYLVEPAAGVDTLTVTNKGNIAGTNPHTVAPSHVLMMSQHGNGVPGDSVLGLIEYDTTSDTVSNARVDYDDSLETLTFNGEDLLDIQNGGLIGWAAGDWFSPIHYSNLNLDGFIIAPFQYDYNTAAATVALSVGLVGWKYDYAGDTITLQYPDQPAATNVWLSTSLVGWEGAGTITDTGPISNLSGAHGVEESRILSMQEIETNANYNGLNFIWGDDKNGIPLQSKNQIRTEPDGSVASPIDSSPRCMLDNSYSGGISFYNRGAGGTSLQATAFEVPQ